MPPANAASLGQLAVLCRLITEPEHARLRRLLQARTRERRPTSLARLLLKAGFGSKTIRRLLRLGVDLAAVRCDGCGRSLPQGELPHRAEKPCPGCGALVLGFAGFRKQQPDPLSQSRASAFWDSGSGSGSGSGPHTLMASGLKLPALDALATPPSQVPVEGGADAMTTVQYHGVLDLPIPGEHTTLPFDDVLALPRVGRGPRSEEDTIMAFNELVAERRRAVSELTASALAATKPAPGATGRGTVKLVDPKKLAQPELRYGEWVVLRELGEGGVGKVYLAQHAKSGQKAALKVLKADVLRDPEYVERFKREAEAAHRIVHENVVGYIDGGRDPATNQQFIAYEYLDGGSLLDVLAARGWLKEKEALKVARGVALALGVAEQSGIVHRDVKPENILLSSDGTSKLADLGLIKTLDRRTRLTQPGIVVGTPCYMAPEQAMGEDGVDVRADIYALGLCLWQMLAGQVPFEDEDELPALTLMTKHIEEDVPDVRLERPDVSDATAQVVKWMTARKPDERYPNPQTLARDLDLALAGKMPLGPRALVGAPPGPERERLASSSRRRRPAPPAPPSPEEAMAVTQEALPPPLPATVVVPAVTAAPTTPPAPAPAKGMGGLAFLLLVTLIVLVPASCVVTAVLLYQRFGRGP